VQGIAHVASSCPPARSPWARRRAPGLPARSAAHRRAPASGGTAPAGRPQSTRSMPQPPRPRLEETVRAGSRGDRSAPRWRRETGGEQALARLTSRRFWSAKDFRFWPDVSNTTTSPLSGSCTSSKPPAAAALPADRSPPRAPDHAAGCDAQRAFVCSGGARKSETKNATARRRAMRPRKSSPSQVGVG